MEPFDAVVPLGGWCRVTAQARSYFGFNRAYPFDWLITPTKSIIDMLDSRFNYFLKAENLKMREDRDGITCNRYGIQHKHDFLRDSEHKTLPIDAEQIENARSKYAYRFKNLNSVGSVKRAIFIRHDDIQVLNDHEEQFKRNQRATVDDAHALMCSLQTMFPRTEIVLMCINFEAPIGIDKGIIFADEPKTYDDMTPGSFLGSPRGWSEAFSYHQLRLAKADSEVVDPSNISVPMPGYW